MTESSKTIVSLKNINKIFKLLKANKFSCRLVEVKLSLKVAFSDIVRVDQAMFHLQSSELQTIGQS